MQTTRFTLTLTLTLLLTASLGWATDLAVRKSSPQPRAWGYEVRASVIDNDTGKIYPIVMTFKGEPSGAALTAEVERRMAGLENKINNPDPPPETTYTESEVVEILVEKKYLQKGDSLGDLPVKP